MARKGTTEGALVVYGVNVVRALLRGTWRVERLLVAGGTRCAEVEAAAAARGIRWQRSDRDELSRLSAGASHQGVVAVLASFDYADFDELLEASPDRLVVLDGVQDPRNLGAIVRTARAAGVQGVVLPRDRSAGMTAAALVASAGTAFDIPVCRVTNLARSLTDMKERGLWTVGLHADGQTLVGWEPPKRFALVAGGEGEGLRHLIRRHCDFLVSIPMAPGVESLNVSVATGIALYSLACPGMGPR